MLVYDSDVISIHWDNDLINGARKIGLEVGRL